MLSIALVAAAALLIVSWFVPDAIAETSIFPWDRLSMAGPLGIAALLAPPACGALLLLAALLPIQNRTRAVAGRIIGPLAIVLPLLGAETAVPMPGWIVAVAAVAGAAVAAFLYSKRRDLWSHFVLGALPVGMLGFWLTGVIQGEPLGFLAGAKAPIVLYAGMLSTAACAGALLDPELSEE
jgi:hypothetical protein